ncbi:MULTISPECIES: vitamin K epoxide reductase family protein [Arthrobacter]|uniref:vitamin K epoxide reductase family protein n=1 Tax=unclassified Arthrobacter TaxID=235627 RepID=UPI0024BBCB57|nr:vitamin K epoxide reductase family protein [Arthrobacter sp. H35-MC1]MDJ0316000.1 vitamin K epoxide reductase family protein [Arthrobacter sp. H35-MC1]
MPSTKVSTSNQTEVDLPAMVRAKPFGWFLVITGAISWIASFVLVLDRLQLYTNPDSNLSCDFNSWISCGDVMKTPQAAILGFPNPFIGVVAFAVLMTTGVVLLAGAHMNRWFWICMQVGITAGMGLIGWFWFQAVYVLAVLCPYCMIVWAMMIPLFVFITVRNLNHGVISAPPALTKFLNEWAWIIVGLIYVATVASIFFKFMHLIIPSNA